jgi:transposase
LLGRTDKQNIQGRSIFSWRPASLGFFSCLTPTFEFPLMRRRYELTDEQYNRLQPLLCGKPGDPGRNADDNRRFLNAVLWIARTGAPWPDPQERFGKYNTVYQCFNRWAKKGRWQAILARLWPFGENQSPFPSDGAR